MAQYYGTVQGGRGEAHRLGHRNTGLTTRAASWQGAVRTRLYDVEGVDFARVELTTHGGHDTHRVLYDGPVSGAELAE